MHKKKTDKIIAEKQILEQHYQFLRDEDSQGEDSDEELSETQKKVVRERSRQKKKKACDIHKQYGERMAKKYEQKLFKEFALVDLSRYESGQIGCRWRTEKQVKMGKGEKICGEVLCKSKVGSVYEMNFGYVEESKKKNALVKISVCPGCEVKLNYKKQLQKIVDRVKIQENQ